MPPPGGVPGTLPEAEARDALPAVPDGKILFLLLGALPGGCGHLLGMPMSHVYLHFCGFRV